MEFTHIKSMEISLNDCNIVVVSQLQLKGMRTNQQWIAMTNVNYDSEEARIYADTHFLAQLLPNIGDHFDIPQHDKAMFEVFHDEITAILMPIMTPIKERLVKDIHRGDKDFS